MPHCGPQNANIGCFSHFYILSLRKGFNFFFVSFRERLVKDYGELFGKGEQGGLDSVSNFSRKYGWFQSIYALSQGRVERFENITKLDLHQCLYTLTYMKEKQELENKRIKKSFNK